MERKFQMRRIGMLLATLLFLIGGLVAWIIPYPAYAGAVGYETDLPAGYDLGDAREALLNQGYSVETIYTPEYNQYPYLLTKGSRDADGVTVLRITVYEAGDRVDIKAHRDVSIPPHGVFQDLHELSKEQQVIAEEDLREVLNVVGLPSSGTFRFIDEIDSLDFFLPTTVFYALVFVHFPVTVLMAILTVVLEVLERHSVQHPEAPTAGSQH
jgi:hypothetical protein